MLIFGLFFRPWQASLAAYLAAFCLTVIVLRIAERRKTGGIIPASMTEGGVRVTISAAFAVASAFGIAGWAGGYSYRGDIESRVRYTYTDVLVMERNGPRNYLVHPARMEPWQAGLCEDTDWQPGQRMRTFSFEVGRNKTGEVCLDAFAGGYVFYTEHGKRINYNQEASR